MKLSRRILRVHVESFLVLLYRLLISAREVEPPTYIAIVRQGEWIELPSSCAGFDGHGSVHRDAAFQFFDPIEDDVHLPGRRIFKTSCHHDEPSLRGDVVVSSSSID